MKTENIVKFVSSIAICQLAGVIGSVFTSPSIPAWYAALQKPYLLWVSFAITLNFYIWRMNI